MCVMARLAGAADAERNQEQHAYARNSQSCGCCAGVALLTGVANWLYIEPVATDLMFERYALENAEGERDGAKIKALYKQFGMLRSSSPRCGLIHLRRTGAILPLLNPPGLLAQRQGCPSRCIALPVCPRVRVLLERVSHFEPCPSLMQASSMALAVS